MTEATMQHDAKCRLERARAQLVLHQPFFGVLALQLTLEAAPDGSVRGEPVPILATDGQSLYYNPQGVAALNDHELQAAWAHEVLHCALLHHERVRHRDVRLFNIAADYQINGILNRSGFRLPRGSLYDAKLSAQHEYAESIYQQLMPPRTAAEPLKQPPPGKEQPAAPQTGLDRKMEQLAYAASELGKVLPCTAPRSGPESTSATPSPNDWSVALHRAATAARLAGKLPGGVAELLEALRPRSADWFDYLRKFLLDTIPKDFTWSRPSRKSPSLGVYLPSPSKQGIGHVDVAIDTSGSVSTQQLKEFGDRLAGLWEELMPDRLRVIYFDCKVQKVDDLRPGDLLEFHPQGRGGTSFIPVFEWIAESDEPHPRCLVILTDTIGRFPSFPPPYPVLWVCCLAEKARQWRVPPFGDIVHMGRR